MALHVFYISISSVLTLSSFKSHVSCILTFLHIPLFNITGPFTFLGQLLVLHSTSVQQFLYRDIYWIVTFDVSASLSYQIWSSLSAGVVTYSCMYIRAHCSSWHTIDIEPTSSGQRGWVGAKYRHYQRRWVKCRLSGFSFSEASFTLICVCYFLAVTCFSENPDELSF